jgi:hypothetical protein
MESAIKELKTIWFVLGLSVLVFWIPSVFSLGLMFEGLREPALSFADRFVVLPALYYPIVVGVSVLVSFVFHRFGRNRIAVWTAIVPIVVNLIIFLMLFATLHFFYFQTST